MTLIAGSEHGPTDMTYDRPSDRYVCTYHLDAGAYEISMVTTYILLMIRIRECTISHYSKTYMHTVLPLYISTSIHSICSLPSDSSSVGPSVRYQFFSNAPKWWKLIKEDKNVMKIGWHWTTSKAVIVTSCMRCLLHLWQLGMNDE